MKRTPLARSTGLVTTITGGGQVLPFRRPIRAVSKRRARVNRQRAAMADRRWPDRREGTVMCAVPWCPLPADDLHEPLTRARGGSITDENNTKPTCRPHNHELTLEPAWGYETKLLKHSWDDDGGSAA